MLARLFGFQGRMRRSEWWLTRLAVMAIAFVAFLILVGVSAASGQPTPRPAAAAFGLIFVVGFAVVVWIDLATSVKRLHDQDLSGWLCLLLLIPGIGSLFGFVVLGCLDGTRGTNRYGDSAKYPSLNKMALVFD